MLIIQVFLEKYLTQSHVKKSQSIQPDLSGSKMIKRIVYIGNPCYISTENEQIVVNNKLTGEIDSVPADDLGVLVIDHQQAVFTSGCLNKLLENNVAVVFCNKSHLPHGICLSMEGNFAQTERLHDQVNSKLPLRKSLWQQVVKAKIRNQSLLLKKNGFDYKTLQLKIDKVVSGDTTNQEGTASQYYWKMIFNDKKFKRDRDGAYPNNLLNFGYAILRAETARALTVSGLHPSFGLFHKNRYNPYCLADDIMEPYRQYVDETVLKFYKENNEPQELSKEIKKMLLNNSYADVRIDEQIHPLINAIQITCSSLNKCFLGESKILKLPVLCD